MKAELTKQRIRIYKRDNIYLAYDSSASSITANLRNREDLLIASHNIRTGVIYYY